MSKPFLVRHGQSVWNQQNRFTGWVDVSLSRRGVLEAQQAAVLLAGESIDIAFTSTLLRALDSLYEILRQNRHCAQYVRVPEQSSEWYDHFTSADDDSNELKIYISEKLNERYYGDLQGLDKDWASRRPLDFMARLAALIPRLRIPLCTALTSPHQTIQEGVRCTIRPTSK